MAKKDDTKPATEATKLPCGITQEQLNDWKKTYGENSIKQVKVFPKSEDKSHFYSLIVREPDLDAISKASKFISEPFKAGMILYLECKLAVDPEIDGNDKFKASACTQLVKLFKIFEAEVSDL